MHPWELPTNKTQTGVLTRSSLTGAYSNAIRFEDKIGQEQLWLHAEKDQLTEVERGCQSAMDEFARMHGMEVTYMTQSESWKFPRKKCVCSDSDKGCK